MNGRGFQELLDVVAETGDCAFFPHKNELLVLLPAATYRSRMAAKASHDSSTDTELLDTINAEIGLSRSSEDPRMLAIDSNSLHDTLEGTHAKGDSIDVNH